MKIVLILCAIVINGLITIINADKKMTEEQQRRFAKRTLLAILIFAMLFYFVYTVSVNGFIVSLFLFAIIRYLAGFMGRHKKRMLRYRAEAMAAEGANVYLNGTLIDGTSVNMIDYEINIQDDNVYLVSKTFDS